MTLYLGFKSQIRVNSTAGVVLHKRLYLVGNSDHLHISAPEQNFSNLCVFDFETLEWTCQRLLVAPVASFLSLVAADADGNQLICFGGEHSHLLHKVLCVSTMVCSFLYSHVLARIKLVIFGHQGPSCLVSLSPKHDSNDNIMVTLSSSCSAKYVRGIYCPSTAVCSEHPCEFKLCDAFDKHALQQH